MRAHFSIMWHAQDGRTALMHAVNTGTFVAERLSALHVLLKAGANKEAKDKVRAWRTRCPLFLMAGASEQHDGAQSKQTPLMHAVRFSDDRNTAAVRVLLEAGADTEAKDNVRCVHGLPL